MPTHGSERRGSAPAANVPSAVRAVATEPHASSGVSHAPDLAHHISFQLGTAPHRESLQDHQHPSKAKSGDDLDVQKLESSRSRTPASVSPRSATPTSPEPVSPSGAGVLRQTSFASAVKDDDNKTRMFASTVSIAQQRSPRFERTVEKPAPMLKKQSIYVRHAAPDRKCRAGKGKAGSARQHGLDRMGSSIELRESCELDSRSGKASWWGGLLRQWGVKRRRKARSRVRTQRSAVHRLSSTELSASRRSSRHTHDPAGWGRKESAYVGRGEQMGGTAGGLGLGWVAWWQRDGHDRGLHGGTETGEAQAQADHSVAVHGEGQDGEEGHSEEEEEEVLADELVDKYYYANKAAMYQSEFLKSFDISRTASQFIHFLQINATIWRINIAWPPAIKRFAQIIDSIFVFHFELIPYKYTPLLVCAILPFVFYYLSEVFWRNSARWRTNYMVCWDYYRTETRKYFTSVVIATSLLCTVLNASGALDSVDMVAVIWVVFLFSVMSYIAFCSLGAFVRRVYGILETDDERMDFFLRVRSFTRSLIIVAMNLGYLPILGKLFKIIYKAKKMRHHGLHIDSGAWVVALMLAALYGAGFPVLMFSLLRKRKRLYDWVVDPTNPHGGRYEIKPEAHPDRQGVKDEYNFLELEQQVYNIEKYLRRIPLITHVDRREDVVQRVESSLRAKRREAALSRRKAEERFNMQHGHPVDDHWKPLKRNFFWWKVATYYVERGFLVALVMTQDGQKVAKSIGAIIGSFVAVGLSILTVLVFHPYLKSHENWLEAFFAVVNLFNVAVALCLHEKWLGKSGDTMLTYLLLLPNVIVILVAIYIMHPRAIFMLLRLRWRELEQRTLDHRQKEKEYANRQSRALFEAALKGDVLRVQDLLRQGKADVRYRKPKDVKPVGYANWTPTEAAIFHGKHECLELLLQRHTLFTEEEIVSARWLERYDRVQIYVLAPLMRFLSKVSPLALLCCMRRLQGADKKQSITTPATASTQATDMEAGLLKYKNPERTSTIKPGLWTPRRPLDRLNSVVKDRRRLMATLGKQESLVLDRQSALRKAMGTTGAGQTGNEIAKLVELGFEVWSRDCLNLLITYGTDINLSVVGEESQGREQGELLGVVLDLLYADADESTLSVKASKTAQAALHHPRDLQWVLAIDRADVLSLGREERTDKPTTILKRIFRKIRDDTRSTKDMKVLAMGAIVQELAKQLGPNVAALGAPLTVDFSHFGLDDQYLDTMLTMLWDFTSTGFPTNIVLEGNVLTDVGVRSLALRMRESLSTHPPVTSPTSDAHSLKSGKEVPPLTTALSLSAPGAATSAACSIMSLNLNGNRIGTDGALFLADIITDFEHGPKAVHVYRYECSAASPYDLSFDRGMDKALTVEDALVVALVIDAYVGVHRFRFTLHEAEGDFPDELVRLSHLTELDLRGNLLEGQIPAALLLLPQKNFAGNQLTLPTEGLQALQSVTELDLRGIGIVGPLPSVWATLPNLRRLDVSHNPDLEGPVPAELITRVPRISFKLAGCKLSLPTDVNFLLSTLQSVDLSGQGLVGSIPESWTKLRTMKSVNLAYNALQGPVPAQLLTVRDMSLRGNAGLCLPTSAGDLKSTLGHLTELSLRNQSLTGRLPEALTQLTALKSLDVSGNLLTGEIPAALIKLRHRCFRGNRLELPSVQLEPLLKMQSIDMNTQDLVGALPASWRALVSLTHLDVRWNRLTGAVPPKLLTLPRVHLSGNQLSLPQSELESIAHVTRLDLSDQGLTGEIPEAFITELTGLQHLDLSGENSFRGQVPVACLELIQRIDGSRRSHDTTALLLGGPDNHLTLPDEQQLCAVASHLHRLSLPKASLVGQIPKGISILTALERLELPHNNLEGELPESVSLLVSLSHLNVAHNRLTGRLHSWLGVMHGLKYFDVSHNHLRGILPEGLFSCTQLEVVRVHNNFIEGSLPQSLGQLQNLTELSAGNNKLVGAIPTTLMTLTKLRTLDLSRQQRLQGSVPDSVSELVDLEVLRLDGTKLYGYSMEHVARLSKLRVLSLRDNNCVMTLPAHATCLVNLEVLDLGGNRMPGCCAADFPALPSLTSLSLDGVGLEGEVPPSIKRLPRLTSLNLSVNKLSGPVPGWLCDLKRLKRLRLAMNCLEGSLPPSMRPEGYEELKLYGNRLTAQAQVPFK